MLLLPYRDKSVARSVPIVTALIAVACTVVLFGYQGRDQARDLEAYAFYHDSGLDLVEVPRYQAFLAERNDPNAGERLHLLQSVPPRSLAAAQLLQSDPLFLRLLHTGHIVREDDPVFAVWNDNRARFDTRLGATLHARFGLERAEVEQWWRFFSYAFLHSGVVHWLGNMVVLLLVGPFVEAAVGRLRFTLGLSLIHI